MTAPARRNASAAGSEWQVIRLLAPHLARHRSAVAAVISLGAVASMAEGVGISLFIPLLRTAGGEGDASTGHWLTDAASASVDWVPTSYRLAAICVLIVVAIVLTSALGFAYRALVEWVHARIAYELRDGIFERLLTSPLRALERGRSGQMLNTLAGESWRAAAAAALVIEMGVIVATLVVYAGLLLLISWKLTLVTVVAMVAISSLVTRLTRRAARLGRFTTRVNASLGNRMVELLAGLPTIRAMAREPHERERFARDSRRVERSHFHLNVLGAGVEPLYETLAATVVVSICFVGLRDGQGLAALLVFIFVLYRMQPRMKLLDGARTRLRSLCGAVDDVARLVGPAPRVGAAPPAAPGTLAYAGMGDGIRLDAVTFRYVAGAEPAARGVSLELPAGTTTALVGPSGGGKSTLAKLLLGFYPPESGRILIGGVPLATLDFASWRERVAWVSQDLFLFNASVRDNIAYGRPEATEEQIVAAAREAAADAFIRTLPQGYATRVGDGGGRLSGGQRQRITLARALIRRPDLLILDEATNALDSESETLVQEAVARASKSCTVLVIAHRLSTVRQADQVVVMRDGRVAEVGPPDELLTSDGDFAAMMRAQYEGVAT